MSEDKSIGLDFDALKKLADDHDAGVRLRTRDGRIIDITRTTLPEDLLKGSDNVKVDNHDRVGVRSGDHERVRSIHDRATTMTDKLTRPPNELGLDSDGVFLSGLSEQQIAELRAKASDLLQGKEITIFKR